MSAKVFTIGGHTISYGGCIMREAGAGSLTITKTVSGSGFDPSKTFELTATFSSPVTYNGVTSTTHAFHLAHGQSATVTNIPEFTSYTVTESPLSPQDIDAGYSFIGMTGGSGTISDGQVHAIATNGYTSFPARTLRLLYPDGITPTFRKGTGTQVSSSPNVWDLYYDSTSWDLLLAQHQVIRVLKVGDTSGITNMSGMFSGCSGLTDVPLFNTGTCQNMSAMLYGCSSLASVPLFDTSECRNMSYMFYGCSSLTAVPLFSTGACTNMHYMLGNCSSLESVPLFDTSACQDMFGALGGCTSLTTIPLLDTSACIDMRYMCDGCPNVEGGALDLYQQASSQATPPASHSYAFRNCGIDTTTGAAELALIPSDWK